MVEIWLLRVRLCWFKPCYFGTILYNQCQILGGVGKTISPISIYLAGAPPHPLVPTLLGSYNLSLPWVANSVSHSLPWVEI